MDTFNPDERAMSRLADSLLDIADEATRLGLPTIAEILADLAELAVREAEADR